MVTRKDIMNKILMECGWFLEHPCFQNWKLWVIEKTACKAQTFIIFLLIHVRFSAITWRQPISTDRRGTGKVLREVSSPKTARSESGLNSLYDQIPHGTLRTEVINKGPLEMIWLAFSSGISLFMWTLTSHSTTFSVIYVSAHTRVVQADWRRSWTYGRAPTP